MDTHPEDREFPSAALPRPLAVAFSGGVDSSLLCILAHRRLEDDFVALTADTPFTPAVDLRRAEDLAVRRGFRHVVVPVDPLAGGALADNPPDRCYLCKRAVFGRLLGVARSLGVSVLADGTNADDDDSDRPGARAARELGVASPLRDAGLGRADVVRLSVELGLPDPARPNNACLATRVPHGSALDRSLLRRIDAAEAEIAGLGFTLVRLRTSGGPARIELLPQELEAARRDGRMGAIAAIAARRGFELEDAAVYGRGGDPPRCVRCSPAR